MDLPTLSWVILTMGDRPRELAEAVASVREADTEGPIVVVVNGEPGAVLPHVEQVVYPGRNLGIPGGRARGAAHAATDVVAYLDDDATIASMDVTSLRQAFATEHDLAAISFRIVDEVGATTRRHVPRVGSSGTDRPGGVATFLGGACAIRRSAAEAAGGYWADLEYGHEELDLAWRMIDLGWTIRYRPDLVVTHPRTEISRHPEGWWRTGRNRVWVARRNLPRPLMCLHSIVWLAIGSWRAPDRPSRRAFWRGWRSGWADPIDRSPMTWRTVGRLARLGRPPIV